jgi:RND family efflux transporter MFP subunit
MSPRFFFTTLFSALGAAGIVIFGSDAIEANVEPTISTEAKPMPVIVERFELEASYTASTRFLGIVEAASDSNIGFEVAGVLSALDAKEGDFVTTGQLLGRLDIRQQNAALSLAKAQEKEVAAQLELAKLNLQRANTLLAQALVSQREADDARLTVEATQARLETTQASVRNAEIVIEKSELRAPFDAVVSKRITEPGSIVGPNVPIVRLVSVGEREAHVGISPKFANIAAIGEVYTLFVEGEAISARLRSVGADVDPQTLTVLAVLTLPKDQPVRVGQTVALEFEERVNETGGWLPLTALLEGDKGLWTVLVTKEDAAGELITARESVEVVYSEGERVFVRGTVADDTNVVASGMQRLSPGSPVDIVPAIRVVN